MHLVRAEPLKSGRPPQAVAGVTAELVAVAGEQR
jgi:hypothetical protein